MLRHRGKPRERTKKGFCPTESTTSPLVERSAGMPSGDARFGARITRTEREPVNAGEYTGRSAIRPKAFGRRGTETFGSRSVESKPIESRALGE